jgi:RNA polymerase sigma factor (sigma-70 family)
MTRSLQSLIQYLRQSISARSDAALTDTQLLERWIGHRDPAAFELLMWRHGPMVLNTCRRLLPGREDAEDAFQATFLVLLRKAGSIRRREALAAWLHRVACRIAGRARTAGARRCRREQPLTEAVDAPHIDDPSARDLYAILDEEIEKLPTHYRRAVILCCLEGKSQEEAARILDRPRGTVSSWLTRGRERLRQRLLRRGIVVSTSALAALTPDALSSGSMIPLIGSLMRVAGAVAAGGAVPVGLMSARSIVLAEGVLRMMFVAKLKIVAAVSLVAVVMAAGVGAWHHSTRADDPANTSAQTPTSERQSRSPDKPSNEASLSLSFTLHQGDDIAWGEGTHGLQAGIAFRRGDQTTFEIGQSVTFVVYLRNRSTKEISLSYIEPLFEESMPIVENAQGKRLAVATGPIDLGEVPIVHRRLEAGQRIALGYPWFRIRPLGWKTDVLGPTCCAAPGRYKVGYTSLGLRLDDGRDISLGTKKVEFEVRKSPTAKEDRSRRAFDALNPTPSQEKGKAQWTRETAPLLTWDIPDLPNMFYVSTPSLSIPISGGPREDIAEFIFLVSSDQGRTYRQVEKKPANADRFRFQALGDGTYWFMVQQVDKQGRIQPADPSRQKPMMGVCVDTTPPQLELYKPQRVENRLSLAWTAKDANLETNPIRLEWSEKKDGPWRLIGGPRLPNTGHYDWDLPKEVPSHIWVKMTARDRVGNEANVVAPIDLKKGD